MLRSLFSGITGLRQHQTLMDVVGNNISNVNTAGYKSSSVVFEDTLSQLVKASGAPSANVGGVNPAQVGLGVQLGAIATNFSQGSAQNTGRATDLMIQGDGFFVLQNGGQQVYSRAGSFTFDSNGMLVNPEGFRVQGWGVDPTTGQVNSSGAVKDIVLPTNTMIPPKATGNVTLSGNIPPSTTSVMTFTPTVYDKQGVPHPLVITVTPDPATPGTYNLAGNDVTDPANPVALNFGTSSLVFDPANTPPGVLTAPTPDPTDPVHGGRIQVDNGAGVTFDLDPFQLTNYGGPSSINITKVDGFGTGSLQGFQIGKDGGITGTFSNGQKLVLGKVALAGFNNPMGLEKSGNSTYSASTNSGNPQINAPGNGGVGTLLGGAVEMSNVDLAQEFTNLIIAQRGFQANSRVITTSDQMLQDLVDIKR